MQFAMIALSASMLVVGPTATPEPALSDPSARLLENCLVRPSDERDLSAQEMGVLTGVFVKEGDQVTEGQLLAQIDESQAQALLQVAQAKLDAAEAEAENDINKRYSEASAKVTEAEYKQAKETNLELEGVVSFAEIRRLALKWHEALLSVEKAIHDLELAGKNVEVRQAELQAADTDVARRKITSPLEGVVVEKNFDVGEYVRPGDPTPVFRVIGMKRLRVEGVVSAEHLLPSDVDGATVTVTVDLPGGRKEAFDGTIVFASPQIEVGPRFKIFAEVENRRDTRGHWLLNPGQTARMAINPN